ncbi:beta-ureidopropionase [Sporolactobacillus inulinus]|uniref:Beta-ureidopropionase n=1 Tax=Sporolactobacillus inulinus TaxID=2078 RepID=A0A4Y1ZGF9_9BACL|nr:beta-ureidopropionase [Sporolactobacillus inulinus]
MQEQKLKINAERLKETIEKFADFGRTEKNGVTRLSLSNEDIGARDYLVSCCKELGMSIKVDDVANVYATMAGSEDRPPLVMGSHLDTVKKGGRFDGVLGVIAALEVARTLHDHRIQPKIPFMLVDFTNEEGARFDPAMMCSGIISGKFERAQMLQSMDSQGMTLERHWRRAVMRAMRPIDYRKRPLIWKCILNRGRCSRVKHVRSALLRASSAW